MSGTLTRLAALAALAIAPALATGQDFTRAEQLFTQHCAVCHGADRGGYIGPALNRDDTRLSRADVA